MNSSRDNFIKRLIDKSKEHGSQSQSQSQLQSQSQVTRIYEGSLLLSQSSAQSEVFDLTQDDDANYENIANHLSNSSSTSLEKRSRDDFRSDIVETNPRAILTNHEISSKPNNYIINEYCPSIRPPDPQIQEQFLDKMQNLTDNQIASWELILLVDIRERDHLFIQTKMMASGLKCEIRTLALGDYLWIARPLQGSDTSAVVLDCIAERKTIPDLASSIVDRRYSEQKMRLMNCGIPLCIYIVEGTSFSVPQQHTHIKSGAIHSAIVSTHIECGMHVIRTRGIDHTVSTLCAMFNRISHRFRRGKCGTKFFKFEDFQKRCGKKQVENTGELFARMMKQVPGCSSASALALQDRFGTFANILKYCLETDACIAKNEISKLKKNGAYKQKVGPKLAATIYNILCSEY